MVMDRLRGVALTDLDAVRSITSGRALRSLQWWQRRLRRSAARNLLWRGEVLLALPRASSC